MYDTNITQNNFMKGKVKGYYEPGCIAAIELSLRLAFAFGRRRLAAGEPKRREGIVVLVYFQILF